MFCLDVVKVNPTGTHLLQAAAARAPCMHVGSEGDGGKGASSRGRVKRELLGRHTCVGHGERRGKEAWACGPTCMRAREAEEVQTRGVEVPACA